MQRWAVVREQRRPKVLNEDAADGVWPATVAGDRRGAKSRVAGGEIEEPEDEFSSEHGISQNEKKEICFLFLIIG